MKTFPAAVTFIPSCTFHADELLLNVWNWKEHCNHWHCVRQGSRDVEFYSALNTSRRDCYHSHPGVQTSQFIVSIKCYPGGWKIIMHRHSTDATVFNTQSCIKCTALKFACTVFTTVKWFVQIINSLTHIAVRATQLKNKLKKIYYNIGHICY